MKEPSEQLRRLVECAQLERINFLELSARRHDDVTTPQDADEASAVRPTYALTVQSNDEPPRFRLRLRTSIELPAGAVDVEVAAEYTVNGFGEGELTQPLIVEYANHVGVMALLPYVRHAIADLTLRVFGDSLLMPVMARGALEFAAPEARSTAPEV